MPNVGNDALGAISLYAAVPNATSIGVHHSAIPVGYAFIMSGYTRCAKNVVHDIRRPTPVPSNVFPIWVSCPNRLTVDDEYDRHDRLNNIRP